MAQNETWLSHDLMNPVKVQYLDGNLFSMDNAGNLIGVTLTKDGVAYSGGGSVSANVIRADGGTVAVSGALSGNVATVVLPQAAYAVPGVVSVVVKLTVSGEVTTIGAVVANVYESTTSTTIDPGTIIPSIQTLINQINEVVATIPLDYSALSQKVVDLNSAFKANNQIDVAGLFGANGYVSYVRPMTISSSNKYTTSNNGNHVLIPIAPGDSITLRANANYNTYYAILKELDNPANGGIPSFSSETGFTARVQLNNNTSATITAPSDSAYLYLSKTYNALNLLPSEITINGESMTASITGKINQSNSLAMKYMNMTSSIAENTYSKLSANLPGNTFCWINSSWFTDVPSINVSIWLFTIASGTDYNFATQVIFDPAGRIWTRKKNSGSDYGDFAEIMNVEEYKDISLHYLHINSTIASETYSGLAANLPGNTFVYASSSWFSDIPSGLYWIVTLAHSATYTYGGQLAYDLTGKAWSRNKIASTGLFTEWKQISYPVRNHVGKYYAFGDSTTWGYSSDHNHDQSPWNYPATVGKLIGVDVHNVADPGQGLIKNWNTATSTDAAVVATIEDMISNGDFANTVLITVGWAYNDANYYSSLNFGNPSDPIPESTTGITTFLGYYCKVLDMLQKAAPTATVILVTGYGYQSAVDGRITCNEQFNHIYNFADGQKTVKQMYDLLEEMANYYGYACVNQSRGTCINRANCQTIVADNIHPTYDNYRIYGNNIASRIVSLFQNI